MWFFSLDEAWQKVNTELLRKSWNPLMSRQGNLDEVDIPLATLAKQLNKPEDELQNEIEEVRLLSAQLPDGSQVNLTGSQEEAHAILLTDEDIVAETTQEVEFNDVSSSSDDDF